MEFYNRKEFKVLKADNIYLTTKRAFGRLYDEMDLYSDTNQESLVRDITDVICFDQSNAFNEELTFLHSKKIRSHRITSGFSFVLVSGVLESFNNKDPNVLAYCLKFMSRMSFAERCLSYRLKKRQTLYKLNLDELYWHLAANDFFVLKMIYQNVDEKSFKTDSIFNVVNYATYSIVNSRLDLFESVGAILNTYLNRKSVPAYQKQILQFLLSLLNNSVESAFDNLTSIAKDYKKMKDENYFKNAYTILFRRVLHAMFNLGVYQLKDERFLSFDADIFWKPLGDFHAQKSLPAIPLPEDSIFNKVPILLGAED